MSADILTDRVATRVDLPELERIAHAAIAELQTPFLDAAQIEASFAIMGIDTRLVDDGTYYVVEHDGVPVGCGGWSRRATWYGGDHTAGRDDALLDPATAPARVRAMYTHPRFARRGVGRRVLEVCAEAAAAEGFRALELVATMAGEPLYRSFGFEPTEAFTDDSAGARIPLIRMRKRL